jgi:hypothetical protein
LKIGGGAAAEGDTPGGGGTDDHITNGRASETLVGSCGISTIDANGAIGRVKSLCDVEISFLIIERLECVVTPGVDAI